MYGMSPYIKHILDCLIFLQPFRQTQKPDGSSAHRAFSFIYLLLRIGCRAVGVPVKHTELKAFQIAFLIPGQRSHYGIHGVRFQVFGDFSRIVRLIQARLQRLQRGVGGPNECAAWVLFFALIASTMGLFAGT